MNRTLHLGPALIVLVVSLFGCSASGTKPGLLLEEPVLEVNETRMTQALEDLGRILRAYPVRRPYNLVDPVVLEVSPILNFSGEDGLPPELSTMLTTITAEIGFPLTVKPPISLAERQAQPYIDHASLGPRPHLLLGGSVTEGEKIRTSEFRAEMDLLFADREDDGTLGADSFDFGASKERGEEMRTLGLDLHLTDASSGVVVAAVAYRIHVIRRGRSSSFGAFFDGSGAGVHRRGSIAHSKSHALRIAAQQAVLVLIGRHFCVPYWRVLQEEQPDPEVISSFRQSLGEPDALLRYRLLLYAAGIDIALDQYSFSSEELDTIQSLKARLGLAPNSSDVDLAMHIWLSLQYEPLEPRLDLVRRARRGETTPPQPQGTGFSYEKLLELISNLNSGQQLSFPLHFDFASSGLNTEAETKLNLFVRALKASPLGGGPWWIELRGHSDERGGRLSNQKLSEKRAERVRHLLNRRFQIPLGLLVAQGFGSTELVHPNASSEEEHGLNRRVEVFLVAGERPSEASRQGEAPVNAGDKRRSAPKRIFREDSWPLPQEISVAGELSEATLSVVKAAYPKGRLNMDFGYYLVALSREESSLFSEMLVYLGVNKQDPRVRQVSFQCRAGAEPLIRSELLQLRPLYGEEVELAEGLAWKDALGYELTVGEGRYCLKIKPSAG